jgi:hypothetical protein
MYNDLNEGKETKNGKDGLVASSQMRVDNGGIKFKDQERLFSTFDRDDRQPLPWMVGASCYIGQLGIVH